MKTSGSLGKTLPVECYLEIKNQKITLRKIKDKVFSQHVQSVINPMTCKAR